jgi:hypothetical protein
VLNVTIVTSCSLHPDTPVSPPATTLRLWKSAKIPARANRSRPPYIRLPGKLLTQCLHVEMTLTSISSCSTSRTTRQTQLCKVHRDDKPLRPTAAFTTKGGQVGWMPCCLIIRRRNIPTNEMFCSSSLASLLILCLAERVIAAPTPTLMGQHNCGLHHPSTFLIVL